MSDQQTPAPPGDVNVDAMSGAQAGAKLTELGQQAEWRNKLTSGDGQTVKLFHQLAERRSQTETAESLIAAAADPNVPLPRDGGANHSGMSRRDEIVAAQWQLEAGASLEEAAEWEAGAAYVSPSDFQTIERTVRARCIDNPEFTKAYLSGDPTARAIMDRWHRIAVTSRPLPPMPTTGIPR